MSYVDMCNLAAKILGTIDPDKRGVTYTQLVRCLLRHLRSTDPDEAARQERLTGRQLMEIMKRDNRFNRENRGYISLYQEG